MRTFVKQLLSFKKKIKEIRLSFKRQGQVIKVDLGAQPKRRFWRYCEEFPYGFVYVNTLTNSVII